MTSKNPFFKTKSYENTSKESRMKLQSLIIMIPTISGTMCESKVSDFTFLLVSLTSSSADYADQLLILAIGGAVVV
jgi:hypothetical protein